MDWLVRINYSLLWIFTGLTLFGLYRPWLALWWLPISNRKKVLQYYGLPTLILLASYTLLRYRF